MSSSDDVSKQVDVVDGNVHSVDEKNEPSRPATKRKPRKYRITKKNDGKSKPVELEMSPEKANLKLGAVVEKSSETGNLQPGAVVEKSSETENSQPSAVTGKASGTENSQPSAVAEKSSETENQQPGGVVEKSSETENQQPDGVVEKSSETENLQSSVEVEKSSETENQQPGGVVEKSSETENLQSETSPNPEEKSGDNRKSKGLSRRKRMREKRRKESKEILDNIVACINLMQEKLSKYESDETEQKESETKIVRPEEMENIFEENPEDTTERNRHSDSTEKPRIRKKKKNRSPKKDKGEKTATESKDGANSVEPTKKSASKNNSSNNRFNSTHFIALRLRDQGIREKAAELKEHIVQVNRDFAYSFVDVSNLYVTLAVMDLKNAAEVETAMQAVNTSLNHLNDVYNKAACKSIELDCLGTYRGEIVFVEMKRDEGLEMVKSIISILQTSLRERKLSVRKESTAPRLPLMKIRKKYFLKKGVRKIPADLYSAFASAYFGNEEVAEVLFCSMAGKKNAEFHEILASLDLKNNKFSLSNDAGVSMTSQNAAKENNSRKPGGEDEPKNFDEKESGNEVVGVVSV